MPAPDCFGVGRAEEYLGKGKLDAVLVYACEPAILRQVRPHHSNPNPSSFTPASPRS